MAEERLSSVEAKVEALGREVRQEFGEVRHEIAELRQEVRREFGEVRREMRLLHEDVISNIRDLAPDFGPIRREFTQADADLRESIDRRLVPLEAAARARQRKR